MYKISYSANLVHQSLIMRSFGVSFVVFANKRWRQSRCWWSVTPWHTKWRHCNIETIVCVCVSYVPANGCVFVFNRYNTTVPILTLSIKVWFGQSQINIPCLLAGIAGVRRYFDPHDILTPGSKYCNDILTPLRYFDLPNNNQWQSFIFLLYLLDRICHLIRIILMNF